MLTSCYQPSFSCNIRNVSHGSDSVAYNEWLLLSRTNTLRVLTETVNNQLRSAVYENFKCQVEWREKTHAGHVELLLITGPCMSYMITSDPNHSRADPHSTVSNTTAFMTGFEFSGSVLIVSVLIKCLYLPTSWSVSILVTPNHTFYLTNVVFSGSNSVTSVKVTRAKNTEHISLGTGTKNTSFHKFVRAGSVKCPRKHGTLDQKLTTSVSLSLI